MAGRAMLADWGGVSGASGSSGSSSLSILKNGGQGNIAYNGGTVPAPAQRTPTSSAAPYYGGSVPSPAASQATPIPGGYYPSASGVGVDVNRPVYPQQAAQAPVQAAAPVGPPQGGRAAYQQMDAAGQASADQSFLGGDSDYTAQLGEYDRALNDFIDRITGQKKNFETDRVNAVDANSKNATMSTNQLGEDFGARGLSYSGLAMKSQGDLQSRFSDQEKNIDLVAQRNNSDADNRLGDYQAENNIGRGNAKRSALARMAAQQSIIDSNAGMF